MVNLCTIRPNPYPGHACYLIHKTSRVLPPLSPTVSFLDHLKRRIQLIIVAWPQHPRMRLLYRSTFAIEFEQARHAQSVTWWVIHPFSIFRVYWELVMILCIATGLLAIPIATAYHDALNTLSVSHFGVLNKTSNSPEYDEYRKIGEYIQRTETVSWRNTHRGLDYLYLTHIAVKLMSGYYEEKTNTVVMVPGKIVKRYALSLLVPELLSCFSGRNIFHHYGTYRRSHPSEVEQPDHRAVMIIIKILFHIRIVRVHDLIEFIGNWMAIRSYSRFSIHVSKLLASFIIFVHWMACLHWNIPAMVHGKSLYNASSKSWLSDNKTRMLYYHGRSLTYQYMYCLYRSVTCTRTYSYGHTHQKVVTTDDVLMVTLNVWAGKVFLAWAFALLLQYLPTVGERRAKYHRLMVELQYYFRSRRVPLYLQRRIFLLYDQKMNGGFLNETQLLAMLPTHLREEIKLHNCRNLVTSAAIFGGISPSLVRKIVSVLMESMVLPGDVIYLHNSKADSMFFISSGTVALYAPSGEEIGHLSDGCHFGEAEIFREDRKRIFSVVAIEILEVYELKRKDFMELVVPMRRFYNRLRSVALARANDMEEILSSKNGSSRPPPAMVLSGSRTEFLATDPLGGAGHIQYGRTGGCFVSTRRLLVAAALAVAALLAVGLLVYYLAPCPPGRQGLAKERADLWTWEALGSDLGPSPAAVRLPASVRPHYYSLWLQPFVGEEGDNFTFKGTVEVELRCAPEAGAPCPSAVTLHAKQLNVTWEGARLSLLPRGVSAAEARAKRAAGKKYGAAERPDNGTAPPQPSGGDDAAAEPAAAAQPVEIAGHSEAAEAETVTVRLAAPLQPGRNYSLELPFWGAVGTDLHGLYRSSYTDGDGRRRGDDIKATGCTELRGSRHLLIVLDRWLATTHFEATYARLAFPCFDEPAMKARFEVHLARRNDSGSASNMPLERSEPLPEQPGWMWDHYPPSPVMSTYLLAFIVSDLAEAAGPAAGTAEGPRFSVLARPALLASANYSLSIGPRILAFYSEYFNVSYPLPKLTMAAVPDFSAGAMENWGLIIYRESLLLFDPRSTTADAQRRVASVVAHELAHQWFGNLVTMAWWSDLWLNEGFATYVSYVGVNHVEPSWQELERLVTRELSTALELDALESTHPVSVPVQDPAQIAEVFDAVSYSKGACLIRMLNHSLTEPVLRAGLTRYLTAWRYANARQDDLWEALTRAAEDAASGAGGSEAELRLPEGASVKHVMDTWTLQGGYPVVTATRDYAAGSLTLTQRRFYLAGAGKGAGADAEARWHVPVSYATGEDGRVLDTRPRVWLAPVDSPAAGRAVSNVTAPGSQTWLIVNPQQTGYYRVNYDEANWRLLAAALSPADGPLPPAARSQLLSDALALARAGELAYAPALNLTLYLESSRERHPLPWSVFLGSADWLGAQMWDSPDYANLQAFVIRLVSPLAESLGREPREGEPGPQRRLRTAALASLLDAGEPQLLEWARALFVRWANAASTSDNPIPVDMRAEVYCSAVRHGGPQDWDKVLERFRAADQHPTERQGLLRALMCSPSPHRILTLLERSLLEGGGVRLQDAPSVWRAAVDNPVAGLLAFRHVRDNWDDIYRRHANTSIMREVVRSSISGLSTEEDLTEVLRFLKPRSQQLRHASRAVSQALERLRLRVDWRRHRLPAVAAWLKQLMEPATNATAAVP